MRFKIFLHSGPWLEKPEGDFASVPGFRLKSEDAAIRSEGSTIYGRVFDVDEWFIGGMDVFHGVAIGLYSRIQVTATLGGGAKVLVQMYEYHPEEACV